MTSQVKVSVCLAVTYLAEQVVLWIKVQARHCARRAEPCIHSHIFLRTTLVVGHGVGQRAVVWDGNVTSQCRHLVEERVLRQVTCSGACSVSLVSLPWRCAEAHALTSCLWLHL